MESSTDEQRTSHRLDSFNIRTATPQGRGQEAGRGEKIGIRKGKEKRFQPILEESRS